MVYGKILFVLALAFALHWVVAQAFGYYMDEDQFALLRSLVILGAAAALFVELRRRD
jgi:hypothetical protein